MQILSILILLSLLTKHFIIDFPMQGEYQWRNKGTFLHLGGILHAFNHGLGSLLALLLFLNYIKFPAVLCICILEVFVHYFIDYLKMNLNKKLGLNPLTSSGFWVLLGADQCLHQLTYLGMTFYLIS